MSHSVDDRYGFYIEDAVRARTQHQCGACDDPIEPGHIYANVRYQWGGSVERVKRCIRCQRIHLHLRELARYETWPDEELNCGQDYEEEWGGPPPPEIAALAFMSAAELQPDTNGPERGGET